MAIGIDRESRLARLLADALALVPETEKTEHWRSLARLALFEPHSGGQSDPPAEIERLRQDLRRKVSS